MHVTGQGHGRTRVFWQKVRWASDLHQTSTHLLWADHESFTVEAKAEITDETIADEILAAVLELPGGSWSKIREQVTGNASESARVRDRLLAAGQILNTAKRDGYFNLWNADDPATRSEAGTTLERLPFSAPERDGHPEPFPRSSLSRNGERTERPNRATSTKTRSNDSPRSRPSSMKDARSRRELAHS